MGEPFQYDIFISYSSADVIQAEALENLLQAKGLTVWRDKSELRPGDHVEFSVPEALKKSATVAVLWSENSIKSDWVKLGRRAAQKSSPSTPWAARARPRSRKR